jgi:hypothetical protein
MREKSLLFVDETTVIPTTTQQLFTIQQLSTSQQISTMTSTVLITSSKVSITNQSNELIIMKSIENLI